MLGLGKIAKKVFGTPNDRRLREAQTAVDSINSLEEKFSLLSDDEISSKTNEFKKRLEDGETIDALLPEAFANCREAAKRALGLRAFDVQLLGGIFLHRGNISEMKTGEGKTLVATFPAYLNALVGKGVHIVTVNDYLAKRDAEWMSKVYTALGMTTGVVYPQQEDEEKLKAYSCDITYATNNELGFDYLRDNMKSSIDQIAQKHHYFAIVDEVDSILVDEARTPLIISGPAQDRSELYIEIDKLIPILKDHHFTIDEKSRNVTFTDEGNDFLELELKERSLLPENQSLYDPESTTVVHHVNQGLRAHKLFTKDKDYIVRDKQVVLIDEFTGRMMSGRRLSEGLHQAIEAKENVSIKQENQTVASITYQNYFRLYEKLSGMTGTADKEAVEFSQIYGLDVIIIPTNVPMERVDHNDFVFLTTASKYKALINEIEELRIKSSPILVGTVSVESSEEVSEYLKNKKIPHQILNAKHHEKEAEVIANAGKPGMVTIATNMAGRGTDIVLGGKKEDQTEEEWKLNNSKVLEAGGLHILGTERHESRRIYNQLRGRYGRQGDPGYSKFFLSLEDDLLRLFISDARRATFERLGMGDDHIEAKMLSRGIENAQKRIESRNFDARKNLLEYDDVSNDQRQAIYSLRNQLLEEDDISETIETMIEQQFENVANMFIPIDSIESQWKSNDLDEYLKEKYSLNIGISNKINNDKKLIPSTIAKIVIEYAKDRYLLKYSNLGDNKLLLEKQVMLQVLDVHWKEHLAEIDHLRNSVGLRAYAQKNPKNEFKREAYSMFESMLSEIDSETVRILFSLQISTEEEIKNLSPKKSPDEIEMQTNSSESTDFNNEATHTSSNRKIATPIKRNEPKLGRNDLIKITNGSETKEIKYKKAKPLIDSGEWTIV